MRKRQPHRTDLLPTRAQAVEDAPRHDEVSAGVVMRERQAEPGVVGRRPGAVQEDRDCNEQRSRAMPARAQRDVLGSWLNERGRRRGQDVF